LASLVEVAKKVQPSVVNVTTEKTITMKPWDRYGEDFFKGAPLRIFSKGLALRPGKKEKEYRQKQRSGDQGSLSIRKAIFDNNHVWKGG